MPDADQSSHFVRAVSEQRERLAEGVLQSLYLVGRYGQLGLTQETAAVYRELPAADYRAYFAAEGLPRSCAVVRTNHLLCVFREGPGRHMSRALQLGRAIDVWRKILPGLERVTADDAAWCRTVRRVERAYLQATAQPDRLGRSWVFGSLLADLPGVAEARRAMSLLAIDEYAEPGVRACRADILRSWRQHRAEVEGRLRPLPAR